jgi:protein-arginine deiminase
MRSRVCLLLAPISLLLACDGLPHAVLEVSPTSGRAPFEARFDASASKNPSEGELSYRFDVDGDGTWDTEPSSEPVLTLWLETPGRFTPRVEVTNDKGSAVAEASEEIDVRAALANIDVDTDRNGVVEPSDGLEEDVWTQARGAVFFSNWDDDDGDGWRDSRDSIVNGPEDVKDMAEVIIRHSPDLPSNASVVLRVKPAHAQVRLFDAESLSNIIGPDTSEVQLNAGGMRSGERRLLLEGVGGRSLDWDGRVRLEVVVLVDGAEVAADAVELRAAPSIYPDHTQRAERLYVMRISDFFFGRNLEFFNALQGGLDPAVEFFAIDQYRYDGDRWAQDNMQTGYQRVPGVDGPREMLTYLETERHVGYGLEDLVPEELLGKDFGFSYAGGADSSLNYGGNLEVAPPHEAGGRQWRFGRLIVGGGSGGTILGQPYTDRMNNQQLGFLQAQEAQAPVLELSSEWLAVGHIDEVLLFVPDNSRPERPWRVVVSSPTLARAELQALSDGGMDSLTVFQGRAAQTTVGQILGDSNFLAYNELVQARIDSIVDVLMAAMELDDEDLVELPVLFERVNFGGDFSVAYNPGMANLVVANSQLFIPDPEGPRVNGVDVWQRVASANLAPLGLDITYVDVFESYHELMGEAHCGTNVRHASYEAEWWNP